MKKILLGLFILGTIAVENEEFLREMVKKFSPPII